ncbi:MAG: Mannitol operon activator, BglG family [uncultured Rubrobacteraceae bacterium]|uniref:Mannitol operon activator, BglG family n=1 Tax=uncultured Rubrobacteraceae bacterium TaxID=349277 RepID=A0A6J4PWS1_9ACTN|nr:MAG: Mannitol operon activator, BglG family [uncultured Rubrobacteraceae bacterium]
MGLTIREIRLIEVLLRHPEGLTADDLADELGVSARTVHRDLQPASEFLASHDLTLVRQAGRGINVEGAPSARARALEASNKMRSEAPTPEERRTSLLGMLLGSDEPIKLRALASRSKSSIGTVSRDLDGAEEWLAAFGLSLLRKRGSGVRVLGAEEDRRQAMSQLVLQDLDEAAFLSGPGSSGGPPAGPTDLVSAGLMGMIDEERLQTAKNLTREAVERLPYAIADEAFVNLSVHVALMIERLLRGGEIEMEDEVLQRLRETAEYDNAKNLAGAIEQDFRLDVPEEEVVYLTRHLRGTKLRQDEELDRYFEGSDLEIASRVKALIHYVSEQTGVALVGDSSLYTGLLAHVERAIHRLRENMRISNPLLAEMKEDYPALFDLVDRGMKKIFVEDDIPEEEAGFVAMHFGAALDRGQGNFPNSVLIICPSGIGSSKILASRLEKAFPQIRRLHNASLFDLNGLDANEFDLVVSTVPLRIPAETYVQVRPLLSEEEIGRIRDHLREKVLGGRLANRAVSEALEVFGGGQVKLRQMAEATQLIAELVDDVTVERHEARGSIPEAVRLMCASLAARDLVSDPGSLEASLLARMELGGIGIPQTALALFHARDNTVVRPAFSLHDFDEPLDLEGMDGAMMRVRRTLLMVAPLDISTVALEAISEISVAMVEQPLERETFENGSEAQVVAVLQNIFARYLRDKLL